MYSIKDKTIEFNEVFDVSLFSGIYKIEFGKYFNQTIDNLQDSITDFVLSENYSKEII